MEKITETATGLIDKLPAYGTEKLDILHGWAIKIFMVSALVETIISLDTWQNFAWTVALQLILAVIGLWLNRHGKDIGVWIVVILSILVNPAVPHLNGFFHRLFNMPQ